MSNPIHEPGSVVNVNTAVEPAKAKRNFMTGFWIASGVIVATWVATVITIVVMVILGLVFGGVISGLSGLTTPGSEPTPTSQNTECGVDPYTGTIPESC